MDATRRTPTLRRVAMMAALGALTLPAGPAEAAEGKGGVKPPVITSVSPMQVTAGKWLTVRGRNFRRGKHRNSVGFKRDGAAVVFARSDISTAKMLKVRVPVKLEDLLYSDGAAKVPTRFHLRVLTTRFGRAYTAPKLSPMVAARPEAPDDGDGGGLEPDPVPTPPATPPAEGDCDGDNQANGVDRDDDNDLTADTLENAIGTDGCKADSDGDGIIDGYEYRSAVDLNDDEYQQPNTAIPYPGKRPYPNPLDGQDAGNDWDGDGLTLADEYGLWKHTTPNPTGDPFASVPGKATPLSYSDGTKYSVSTYCAGGAPANLCGPGDDGRRVPTLAASGYAKWQDFMAWADATGYDTVHLRSNSYWYDALGRVPHDVRDVDLDGTVAGIEEFTLDADYDRYLSDDERDEDADGLTNFDEMHGRMLPAYWKGCYSDEAPDFVEFAGTNVVDPDSDGDGIRDGVDDQDHDDFPNLMELSRFAASAYQFDETDDGNKGTTNGGGPQCVSDPDLDPTLKRHATAYGQVNPFNRCLPDLRSRTCPSYAQLGKPFPGSGPIWWALN